MSKESNKTRYVYPLSASASFADIGLTGYIFGPLNDPDVEVCYIDVTQGHDTFQISREITRIYYVLSGTGYFIIAGQRHEVGHSMVIEVPPGTEYSYSGAMRLIAFMSPRWFAGNDTATKWNPDVTPQNVRFEPGNGVSWQSRLLGFQVLGKSPVRFYFRLNQKLWDKLPSAVTNLRPLRFYGDLLNKLVRIKGDRAQGLGTCFFRNRPALELIRRIAERKEQGETLRLAVLGCSAGAEVYSIAWTIKSARPDLKLQLQAVDISREVVELAKGGAYPVGPAANSSNLSDPALLERMSRDEITAVFDREGDVVKVKPWIREGTSWHAGDVGDPGIVERFGMQDIVIANNFLCHMSPGPAGRSLRNIARLVSPRGYLFVAGIDLDVRTNVARELGWKPAEELLEEIHSGDKWLRQLWPGHYAGLEPLDKHKPDWKLRYAAAFQLSEGTQASTQKELDSAHQEGVGRGVS